MSVRSHRHSRGSDTDADLYFAPTHAPYGFTHPALSHFDGDAEPVVRELIQNSVDAADKAGRACEVRFEIRDIDNHDLPGFDTYRDTFQMAVSQREEARQGQPATHDETTIVERIERHLTTPNIPVLICSDNGTGITPARMQSLLTSGNSDKGDGGAGSFGLGHHAAFSASDLRYVLYASRFRMVSGDVQAVASGHAVLATHIREHGNAKKIHANDGYWVQDVKQGQLFMEAGEAYPRSAPPMLRPVLEAMADTGMAVCIAGFNEFQREASDPTSLESIAYVAASNFCDAICEEVLTVTIRDERTGDELAVDHSSLEHILRPRSNERRAPKQGQIQGSHAFNAFTTLRFDHEVDHALGDGVHIRVRPLDGNVRSRVHLYRKGMWITSSAEKLRHNDFSDYMPFDAVVSLRSGDLENFVRSAEGPEHRGIDFKRLNEGEKRHLRRLLRELADVIRATAVAKSEQEEYRPEDFAVVQGDAAQTLEAVGRTNPALGGSKKGRGKGGTKSGKGTGSGVVRQAGRARPGTVPKFAWAPLPLSADNRCFSAVFRLQEDVKGHIGIRLSVPTGSDQTCDSPLPQRFLQLRSVRSGDSVLAHTPAPNGAQELAFAPPVDWTLQDQRRILEIESLSDQRELAVAQLEVVRRQPPKAIPRDESDSVSDSAAEASEVAS